MLTTIMIVLLLLAAIIALVLWVLSKVAKSG